jgi:L-lactate dehydrogenase
MKVGMVGTGAVGSACALALAMRGCADEIVLVDRTRKRAKAVATDIRYGMPLSRPADIGDGDYKDLAGAALVMITVGVNEKAGGATDRNDPSGRLRLLDTNAAIYSHHALSSSSSCGESIACWSLPPLPSSTRISMRLESMSPTR